MVGAGFSLNAINGSILKGWGALAQGMYSELHPGETVPSLGTSDMLRLAEEYKQTFSRSKLDNFIREQLPDERVAPGPLHKDLLKLPWSEIFTTNYDTLIERAAELDIETPHYTVMCREDIPESRVARRRRIVKLHGSFPSQRPFIFTEEDYRLYPTKFAPFVNLVRQSLLENVFCLIGFSGDDPNFLSWIGWVRDMLEAHTLPIYLFLDKAPTYGQLRLLQSRHITAVVLPMPDNVENPTYADRYNELFRQLTIGDDSTRVWPRKVKSPEYVDITKDKDGSEAMNFFVQLLPLWREVRTEYPGWLVAPFQARQRLYRQDDSSNTPDLGTATIGERLRERPLEGLLILSEYIWRQRTSLLPLWDNVAKNAELVLNETEVYLEASSNWPIAGLPASWGKIESATLTQAWFEVALAFLHWARQQMSLDKVNTWVNKLNKKTERLPLIRDAVIVEQIQFFLLQGDRKAALGILVPWVPDPVEPFNGVLRATWLAECDIDSRETIQNALVEIRKLARQEPNSNWVLSREAWACQAAYRIERSFEARAAGTETTEDITTDLLERLRNLSVREHDPERELDKLIDLVDSETYPLTQTNISAVEFDLGHYKHKMRLGGRGAHWEKIRNCFSWIELAECVGYFPRANDVTWNAETFFQAAWWLKNNESSKRIHGLMVRTYNRKLFDAVEPDRAPYLNWLTRNDIARLDTDFAQSACIDALRLAISELAEPQKDPHRSNNRCEFQLERYSRLVLRETRSKILKSHIEEMLNLYVDSRLHQQTRLWGAFSNAFTRTLTALPQDLLNQCLPKLFSLPLMPNVSADYYLQEDWPEWSTPVWKRGRNATKGLEIAARECALRLSNELTTKIRTSQSRVNRRIRNVLFLFLKNDLLDRKTKIKVGHQLWDHVSKSNAEFFFEFGDYLRWPAPSNINAKKTYKTWLLGQKIPTITNIDTSLGEPRVAVSIQNDEPFLRQWLNSPIEKWAAKDLVKLTGKIQSWWSLEAQILIDKVKDRKNKGFLDDDDYLQRFEYIDLVIAYRVLPEINQISRIDSSVCSWIFEFVAALQSIGKKVWHTRIALCEYLQVEDQTLLTELLSALYGNDNKNKKTSISAVSQWATKDSNSCPNSLLNAIITMVGTRTRLKLDLLKAIRLISEKNPKYLNEERRVLLSISLDLIFNELDYAKGDPYPEYETHLIPEVRWECCKLALLLKREFANDGMSNAWINNISQDALPEIRHLVE